MKPARRQSYLKISFAAVFAAVVSTTVVGSIGSTAPADPAEHLMAVARQADSVSIEFYSASGKKEEVTFTDIVWVERLASTLALTSYKPQDHCLCISSPTIRLMRKHEVIATLSVHHGEKLRAYAGEVSGDFLVGARTGKAIVDLANEKRRANAEQRSAAP